MVDLLIFLVLTIGLLGLAFGLARSLPSWNLNTLRPQIEMVGREARVMTSVGQGYRGTVKVEGELWAARLLAQDGTDQPAELEVGRRVRIVEQRDLLLLVEPLPEAPQIWEGSFKLKE
jgi:membrane protein implicated in regulation of membrane protease activity